MSTQPFEGEDPKTRQAEALAATFWESLMSGALGVHFFHWNDRNGYTPEHANHREKGFGIVEETRRPKPGVYANVGRALLQMENARIDRLLGGSSDPPTDVQLFWPTSSDMVWPSANQENAMIWGALKRLGFQPGVLNDAGFAAGRFTNAPALLLSRVSHLDPDVLHQLASRVLPAGVHLHAVGDFPGQVDAYQRPNADWAATMNTVFGVGVDRAAPVPNALATNTDHRFLTLRGAGTLGAINPNYRADCRTWRLWQDLTTTSGRTILTHSGLDGTHPGTPALVVADHGAGQGRAAVLTFAAGDVLAGTGSPVQLYDLRHDLFGAVYRTHFGLRPTIELSGPGAKRLISDYRLCANGTLLVSLMNEQTNAAQVTLTAPTLLSGRQVEDLLGGGVLTNRSSGSLTFTVPGDRFVLLHIYDGGVTDTSLVNPNPNKLWLETAPSFLWPRRTAYPVEIGHDLRDADLELFIQLVQLSPRSRVIVRSAPIRATGAGRATTALTVPDADLNEPGLISSSRGGEYALEFGLVSSAGPVIAGWAPVQVSWGLRPVELPWPILPGRSYPVALQWEDLPGYDPDDTLPLDRARLWESAAGTHQRYEVVLELWSSGQPVTTQRLLTRAGTGTNLFSLSVPSNATGPYAWQAYLQTAANVSSHDVEESFEGRERGASWPDHTTVNFMAPWTTYNYTEPGDASKMWQNAGVHLHGSDGSQSGFLIMTNLPNQLWSGFGIKYSFPAAWALPTGASELALYRFTFDFREERGLPCRLELQLKSGTNESEPFITFSQQLRQFTGREPQLGSQLGQILRTDRIPVSTIRPAQAGEVHLADRLLDLLAASCRVGTASRPPATEPQDFSTTGLVRGAEDTGASEQEQPPSSRRDDKW